MAAGDLEKTGAALRGGELQLTSTRAALVRAAEDGALSPALQSRGVEGIDQVAALQRRVSRAIEERSDAATPSFADWKSALVQASATLEELEASLEEQVERP